MALVRKVKKIEGEVEQKVGDPRGTDQMNEQPKGMYHLRHRRGEIVYFMTLFLALCGHSFAFALGVGIQTF